MLANGEVEGVACGGLGVEEAVRRAGPDGLGGGMEACSSIFEVLCGSGGWLIHNIWRAASVGGYFSCKSSVYCDNTIELLPSGTLLSRLRLFDIITNNADHDGLYRALTRIIYVHIHLRYSLPSDTSYQAGKVAAKRFSLCAIFFSISLPNAYQ